MPSPFDLCKIFVDPANFDATRNGSALQDDVLTEVLVKDLPDSFSVERAMSDYANYLEEYYPQAPDTAWASWPPPDTMFYFMVAFKHPVEITLACDGLHQAIIREYERCGVDYISNRPTMYFDTQKHFPAIADYINETRGPQQPTP